jgi:predicted PurR-regulated permease PerM
VAAGITTLVIVLIVLVPLVLGVVRAAREGVALATYIENENIDLRTVTSKSLIHVREVAAHAGITIPEDEDLIHSAEETIKSWITPATALSTGHFLINLAVSSFVLIVSLYFFMADGSTLVDHTLGLTPLDARYSSYVRELIDKFDEISRAVVLATLAAAAAQGLLAGRAYYIAGLNSVFLLTVATMLLALVPFVGAAAVWIPCAIWVFYTYPADAHPGWWAAFLVAWGLGVVSVADNFIKPYVLHGHSNLHPLLALISILGGIEALGPIGIFVGPMVVAFFQALLTILRTELESMEGDRAGARGKRASGAPHRH